MEVMTVFIALVFGLLVRLALPIAVTMVLIYFLRKLDARWQAEAEFRPVSVQKPECWKIKGCPPERQKNCLARNSPLPCWQVFRQSNGYLQEECLSCKVFIQAPTPNFQIEPRRM